MIIGCVITYNDYPLIVDCINSLIEKVDKIIVIDGKYVDFPIINNDIYSTDGTYGYLDGINKVHLLSGGCATEVEKRNFYLDKCNDGDIVINLDADEILVGELPELKTDFGILELWDGHCDKKKYRATRFFRYREGMRYQNVHYTLYYNGKQLNNLHEVIDKDTSFEYIKGCHLLHNWHMRDHLRQHYKSIYYKKLVQNERGFPR